MDVEDIELMRSDEGVVLVVAPVGIIVFSVAMAR
jgi:hypothetical protein